MQPNQISLKKAVWLYSFAFATVLLVNLSSCKQDEKPVKGQCITFSNAKMKKAWSKPGYLKKIEYIKFVTYYNSVNNEIKVFAQAYSKDYKPIGDFRLQIGDFRFKALLSEINKRG